MTEANPASLKISDIIPDRGKPSIVRLEDFVAEVSEEIGLDPSTQESLRRYSNVYFRHESLRHDFANEKILFKGYALEFNSDGVATGNNYYWVKRGNSQKHVKFLARTAFDVFDTYLSGNEESRIAVFRVREFIHALNR